jgi:hypothetical protein
MASAGQNDVVQLIQSGKTEKRKIPCVSSTSEREYRKKERKKKINGY